MRQRLTKSNEAVGPWLKAERADLHIRDLNRLQRRFFDSDAYETFSEYNSETRHLYYRVKINRPIPRAWAILIGDVLHNLRSALDVLANQAISKGGGTVTNRTGFPIWDTKEKLKSALEKGQIKGAPRPVYKIVRALKPYQGGNDLLWWLHRLNIKDKHRLVVPVGISHSFEGMQRLTPEGLEPVRWRWNVPEPPTIYPIEDGSTVFETIAPRYKKIYDQYKFPFEIAFNEPSVVQGEPVVPTLNSMSDLVKSIIKDFDSLVFL